MDQYKKAKKIEAIACALAAELQTKTSIKKMEEEKNTWRCISQQSTMTQCEGKYWEGKDYMSFPYLVLLALKANSQELHSLLSEHYIKGEPRYLLYKDAEEIMRKVAGLPPLA